MQDISDLRERLAGIDRKSYGAYKSIKGSYDFGRFVLHIDHVQSDPFAPPSRMRVVVGQDVSRIPGDVFEGRSRRIAVQDFLTRQFALAAGRAAGKHGGTGRSGVFEIDRCGQEILERTAMLVNEDRVEARFVVGLPARGRTIMGREAAVILCDELPDVVEGSLVYSNLDKEALEQHAAVCEDQDYLRQALDAEKLVAFVGNGSVLPRESGVSDRPLGEERTVAFVSPPELEVRFDLPNAGNIAGMGVPEGVTLIVGGGYHGKSTLLLAIERGVYNHIPGDGRERVVASADAVKIRAEDGRSVVKVDISGFIDGLPNGEDTSAFSTGNASGSTSQAANIVEALETGSRLLLLDEDTSATNFMIRDGRMQLLVARENEPITPFIDRVRELYEVFGVSTILVVGGSGDYFGVADRVLMLQNYLAHDVTAQAKEIAAEHRDDRRPEVRTELDSIRERAPLRECFGLGPKEKVKVRGYSSILFGRTGVDLSQVEQLVDGSQTRAIAEIMRYAPARCIDGRLPLSTVIDNVLSDIDREGLDVISPFRGQHPGDYARPRKQEIAAAFNRFRGLRVRQLR